MPNDFSWPRIRAILDTALESKHGIVVPYPTWSVAARIRINAYKIRKMQRDESRKFYPDPTDPNHGVSPYDGLTMWLRSSISRQQLLVQFHTESEISELNANAEPVDPAVLPEYIGKTSENENLFPGKCVTLTVETPRGPAIISHAPSFRIAWEILREDFPCDLVIENGYTLDGLNITEL